MNLRLFGIKSISVGHLPRSETGLVKNSTYHCFPICISDLHKSLHPGKLAFCESSLFLKYSKGLIYKCYLLQSLIPETGPFFGWFWRRAPHTPSESL